MSKSAAHTKPANTRDLTRSNASVAERQNSLGAHLCIQREANGLGVQPDAPSLVRDVLNSPGQPLDAETRSLMEPQFGYDFSGVRVHTDETAAQSARCVNAKAYTTGTHVAFDTGQYRPESQSGERILAHELTHVVQQSSEPVAGTNIGEGVSISSPGDYYERQASLMSDVFSRGSQPAHAISARPLLSVPADNRGSVFIQRVVDDTSGTGAFTARQTNAAEASATAGAVSAGAGVASALGTLVSGFEAIRQANFAERSAVAAEDPPVAEPTSGGVNSTHVELPEVKGVNLQPHEDVLREKTLSSEHPVNQEETTKKKGPVTKSTLNALRTNETGKVTTTLREADTADQEKSFTVLRLAQGQDNSADFVLTLRYNNTDVRGGATEDGEINGYLGGSAQSNAAVTFRASPGGHIPLGQPNQGVATVRLLFGGTNVPARRTLGKGTGFLGLGGGGTEANQDYKVQRFSAAVKFSGKGEFLGFDTLSATPRDRSMVQRGTGGPSDPLVTISLSGAKLASGLQSATVNPSAPAAASGGPPPSGSAPGPGGAGGSAPTGGGSGAK
jgi:hypothetical protein